jgi:hypothetical protein
MKKFRLLCGYLIAALLLASCEKPVFDGSSVENTGNVTITFEPTRLDYTRGSAVTAFTKLNVQLFDKNGEKVFEKVKTQLNTDNDFCTMSLKLSEGTYTVVAVGHSSHNSAAIKSPESVQFTASDGEKLTDTFCACQQIVVSGSAANFTLPMYRVGAMIQFVLTDNQVPNNFAYFLMEYTGGSANFNPTTLQGTTKSSQSERRVRNSLTVHQCYTFPYMANSCTLKMTVSGLDSEGTVIRKRVFDEVPVTRNRITTYTGKFFEDGDGIFTQSDFGFVIHADWDGDTIIHY